MNHLKNMLQKKIKSSKQFVVEINLSAKGQAPDVMNHKTQEHSTVAETLSEQRFDERYGIQLCLAAMCMGMCIIDIKK